MSTQAKSAKSAKSIFVDLCLFLFFRVVPEFWADKQQICAPTSKFSDVCRMQHDSFCSTAAASIWSRQQLCCTRHQFIVNPGGPSPQALEGPIAERTREFWADIQQICPPNQKNHKKQTTRPKLLNKFIRKKLCTTTTSKS